MRHPHTPESRWGRVAGDARAYRMYAPGPVCGAGRVAKRGVSHPVLFSLIVIAGLGSPDLHDLGKRELQADAIPDFRDALHHGFGLLDPVRMAVLLREHLELV